MAVSFALLPSGAARAEERHSRYDDAFRKYSKRYFGPGFDWRLFKAQAMAESGLDPVACSGVGARGLMQLMPSTFVEVQSKNPEFASIDDPVWNIAAGICYDRRLWGLWSEPTIDQERVRFVMGSYNAGRGTLLKARTLAEQRSLDTGRWESIRAVAPDVPRWRHTETLGYVERIETNLQWLCVPRRLAVPGGRGLPGAPTAGASDASAATKPGGAPAASGTAGASGASGTR